MSFNLYFAGGQYVPLKLTEKDTCGKLYSFADGESNLDKYLINETCKIFMDSGAFSVHHSGKEIDLDTYISYINKGPNVTYFAALDEIPFPILTAQTARQSAENSWKNYCYMLDHVKPEYRDKIVPTYHYGEPIEYIHRIINGYKKCRPSYMAFGGRAGISKKPLHLGLETFFSEIKKSKNPNIKVHGFGITQLETLELFPFYSADSTSWLRTGVYGSIYTKVGKRTSVPVSKEGEYRLDHFKHYPKYLQDMILAEISKSSLTYEDLNSEQKYRHLYNCTWVKNWADNFIFQPKKVVKRIKLF